MINISSPVVEYRRTFAAAIEVCRDALVDQRVRAGIAIGFGRGVELALLASLHPNAEVLGYDIDPAALRDARCLLDRRGLQNVNLYEADVEDLEGFHPTQPIDVVLCLSALHLLRDSVESTRRWAQWAASGALLITVDWLINDSVPDIHEAWEEQDRNAWPLVGRNPLHPSTSAVILRRSRNA